MGELEDVGKLRTCLVAPTCKRVNGGREGKGKIRPMGPPPWKVGTGKVCKSQLINQKQK